MGAANLKPNAPAMEQVVKAVCAIVAGRTGVQFGPRQRNMVESRLKRRMSELHMEGFEEYQRHLNENTAEETEALVSSMDGLEVIISVKVGDEGQLFEKISSQKICDKLKEMGFTILRVTLHTWCRRYKFAKKLAGRWYIDKTKFVAFMQEGKKYADQE